MNTKYISKIIGLLIIGLNIISSCETNDTNKEQLALDMADGSALVIPTSGPLANDTAIAIYHEVQTIDTRLKKLQKSLNTTNNPKVVSALLDLATEYRNESVSELDLAYRISKKTSGILDRKILKSAKEKTMKAFSILRATPPPSLFVRTEISTTVDTADIHYISFGDYRSKKGYWSSYSFGQRIKIGRYMFRVQFADPEIKPCEEVVLILSDPTVHKIIPKR